MDEAKVIAPPGAITFNISTVALSVNSLNTPIKRQRFGKKDRYLEE